MANVGWAPDHFGVGTAHLIFLPSYAHVGNENVKHFLAPILNRTHYSRMLDLLCNDWLLSIMYKY